MRPHNGWTIAASVMLAATSLCAAGKPGEVPDQNSPWVFTAEASVAGGYKENLLYSHVNRESSALIQSSINAGWNQLPVDGLELGLFVTGEDIRYPGGRTVRKEQSVIAIATARQNLGEDWRISLKPQFLYFDQVYDGSVTETNLVSQPTKSQQFSITPEVRWNVAKRWSIRLEVPVLRETFDRADLDYYWESGPKLSLGFEYGHRSDVTLATWAYQRFYDSRNQFSQTGAAIPGTHLRYRMHAAELANTHFWDRARHWRTRLRLEYLRNTDNGGDWFSYHEFLAAAQLRFRTQKWSAELEAKAIHYQYDHQLAGPTFTDTRHRTNVEVTARAERYISKSWKLFAEFSREQSFSNEVFDDYAVNRGLAGINWEY